MNFALWRERYSKLVEEYGTAAIGTYLVLFFGTWVGFWLAIRSGIQVEGAMAESGTIGGAYLATKLTQPIRIAATVVLTPLVVGAWHRLRGRDRIPEVKPPPPSPPGPEIPPTL
jgi:hypothetical protein